MQSPAVGVNSTKYIFFTYDPSSPEFHLRIIMAIQLMTMQEPFLKQRYGLQVMFYTTDTIFMENKG
ncbi:hypothetical protein JCM10550A_16170 [Methanogenium cariaci]|jgi:hypothetical protein